MEPSLLDRAKRADVKIIVGTDPAANTEFSETVPAAKAWLLVTLMVELVQGITQTPAPRLVLDDGTTVFFQARGSNAAQQASQTWNYNWSLGGPAPSNAGSTPDIIGASYLPDKEILWPGYRVRSITAGIGVNSNFGAPILYVVEYQL